MQEPPLASLSIDSPPPPPPPTRLYSSAEYNPNISTLYIRTPQLANHELAKLGSGPQALGFDLEWKPNFRKGAPENPVALVQLSNHDTIYLLQISAMKEFPSKLAQILANPSIVKAGVAIQSDAKKLYYDCHVPMYNCVDLSLLARTVDNARWKGKYNNSLGLARLTETYEYRLLPKGKTTRSNWEATLDDRQIEYASNDAHAGYILYKKLESMISLLQHPPKSVWYTFNLVSGQLLDPDGRSWHAHNPYYDPGPPPPPKLPRLPRAADIIQVDPSQNGDSSSTSKKDRNILYNRLGRHEIERRPLNTLPSHPYGTAYQEQAQSSFEASASITPSTTSPVHDPAQYLPNRNRRHQPRRNANNGDNHIRTTTTLTSTQTSQTQLNGSLPRTVSQYSSAQRFQQVSTHRNQHPIQ